jgi:uncharacterized protein (TIGR03083 family)
MESPESLVKLVRSESEHLEHYLASLPAEAWSRPSACDQWEVRDVVAHLVFWAELYTNAILRAVQGDISPPAGWPPTGALARQPMMEFTTDTAITCRKNLGDQLLVTFRSTNEQFHRVLMGLAPQDWEQPSYHPARIGSVRTRVETRLLELAVHGWDICSKLEPVAHLSVETLPVLSHRVGQLAVTFLGLGAFRLSHKRAEPARYRFALTDRISGGYDLVVEDDGCRMEPAVTTSPHVTCHLDTETFVLMGLGRLTLDSVIEDGRLAVEGDGGLVDAFIGWFKRG